MRLTREERVRDLIAQASVLAEAPAAGAFDKPQVSHGKTEGNAPRGDSLSLADKILADWNAAEGNELAEHRVLFDAAQAIDRARYPTAPATPVHGTLEWKRALSAAMHKATTGGEAKEVARVFGTSRATAYRIKARYGPRRAA